MTRVHVDKINIESIWTVLMVCCVGLSFDKTFYCFLSLCRLESFVFPLLHCWVLLHSHGSKLLEALQEITTAQSRYHRR